MKSFEDIQAWQKSRLLCIDIYSTCTNCKDYSFRDQIQRAATSVMNNIAEGFERNTTKEFKQFLYIAKGSCGEVRSMAILGQDIGYFTNEKSLLFSSQADEISRMLHGLIKALEKGSSNV